MCFLDARVKPERDSNKNKSGNDKKKNKSDNDNYLSVIPVFDTGIYKRYSGQGRI